MTIIDKAALHILDAAGSSLLSAAELPLAGEAGEYLLAHIEKSRKSPDKKAGTFYDDSACRKALAAYLAGEVDFLAFSRTLAESFLRAFSHAADVAPLMLFVLEAHEDERRELIVFLCRSHAGFSPAVIDTEGGLSAELSACASLLPSASATMDEFAFVDLATFAVHVRAKRYAVDGNAIFVLPELVLECGQAPSAREALKKARETAKKVAEAYGGDAIETAAAVKSFVANELAEKDAVNPFEAGREVFRENPAMQADYEQAIKEAGFAAPVEMDKESILKKMRNHKLKTDTGIELVIPTDYFDNTEFVEFRRGEDGTISITLKQIQNIVDRG